MRLGTIIAGLVCAFLFSSSASAMQLRLIDRPLAHPLSISVRSPVLSGSGGDGSASHVPVVVVESVTSLVINGLSLVGPLMVFAGAASDAGVSPSNSAISAAVLVGGPILAGVFSTLAIYGIARAFGDHPSYARMLGWSLVARLGSMVVMLPFALFAGKSGGLVLVLLGSAMGTVAGTVLDVVMAQQSAPPSPPADQGRPMTPPAEPESTSRIVGVPLIALRF